MKKIILIAQVSLIAVIFSGCAHFSGLQKNSWQKYENNRLGFLIEYPKDWMVVFNDGYGVIFSNTPLNKWVHGLGVPGEKGGMWAEVHIAGSFKCQSHDYESIFDEPDIGTTDIFEKHVCKNDFVIVLGFNPKSADHKVEKKILENILNTFQVRPRK